jgi:DNA-binding GntR family transcriptional regulator
MLKSHFYWMVPRRIFPQLCLFVLVALLLVETAWTQTVSQPDGILHNRIIAVRQKIDTAASWHGTDDQLGRLWHQLAMDYQDTGDPQRSEEAFTHSLKLLRSSPEQGHYAAALDDLASFYLANGRLKEAESCQSKALAIYEGLGDEFGVSRVHVNKAIELLQEHRFAESEDQSAKVLTSLQKQKEPNQYDVVATLITNSYAKCFQNRCDEGLVLARQALGVARAAFAKDSLEGVAALLAVGFEEWKTGAEAVGEQTMREALDVVRQKKNMPHAQLVGVQLRVLNTYRNYLKATHQKLEERQIETEISRLSNEQTPYCKDCTVNALALSANAR